MKQYTFRITWKSGAVQEIKGFGIVDALREYGLKPSDLESIEKWEILK